MNPTVVIFGANGFLGRYLCRHFARTGREVVAIARSRKGWSGDGMFLEWDGKTQGPWALALEGAELVINLAGRSVNCRYNATNKEEIFSSRTDRYNGDRNRDRRLSGSARTVAEFEHGDLVSARGRRAAGRMEW